MPSSTTRVFPPDEHVVGVDPWNDQPPGVVGRPDPAADPRLHGGFPLRLGRGIIPVPGLRILRVGPLAPRPKPRGRRIPDGASCAGCGGGFSTSGGRRPVRVWFENPVSGRRPRSVPAFAHAACAGEAVAAGTFGAWIVEINKRFQLVLLESICDAVCEPFLEKAKVDLHRLCYAPGAPGVDPRVFEAERAAEREYAAMRRA